ARPDRIRLAMDEPVPPVALEVNLDAGARVLEARSGKVSAPEALQRGLRSECRAVATAAASVGKHRQKEKKNRAHLPPPPSARMMRSGGAPRDELPYA